MRGRILVVEDETTLARMVARGLQGDGYHVEVANDGVSGLARAVEDDWDLLLLDWMLPGIDGPTVCRRLRDRRDPVPILMLTARDDVRDRIQGLDTGADDYLAKPFDFDELRARIAALLRRGRLQRRRLLTLGALRIDTDSRVAHWNDSPLPLTPKEYDLVEILATREDTVVDREVLMARLWPEADTASNNLEVLVAAVRRKLECDGRPRTIHTAHRRGYLLKRPEAVDTESTS
ncbi:MAG: response regulator transcription factor [Armatimonadota bacterium]